MPPVAFSSLCASREFLETPASEAFLRAFAAAKEWTRSAPPEEIATAEVSFFPGIAREALIAAIRAYQQLGNFEEAAGEFQEVIQFEPAHPAAHYNLSQVLLRLGKDKEANQELAEHQKLLAGKPSRITDPSVFERCSYTQIRAPFRLEQPEARGGNLPFA